MNMTYKFQMETTIKLDARSIYALIQESIEQKLGKTVTNICWNETDGGMTCELILKPDTVEVE